MNKIFFYNKGLINFNLLYFNLLNLIVTFDYLLENIKVSDCFVGHYIKQKFYFCRNTTQKILEWLEFFNQQLHDVVINYANRNKIKLHGVFIDLYKPDHSCIFLKDIFFNILMKAFLINQTKNKKI